MLLNQRVAASASRAQALHFSSFTLPLLVTSRPMNRLTHAALCLLASGLTLSACAVGEVDFPTPAPSADMNARPDMKQPPKDMPRDQDKPKEDLGPDLKEMGPAEMGADMDMSPVDMKVPGPCGGITCGATEVCRLNTCVDLCDGVSCGEVTDSVTQKTVTCGMCQGTLACLAGECVDVCTQAAAQCGELVWSGVVAECGVCQSGQEVCHNNICTRQGYREVAVGRFHTCASFSNGEVKCWGDNSCGQLGTEAVSTNASSCAEMTASTASTRALLPTALPSLSGVTSIESFSKHSCASTQSGDLYCWGRNNDGQLGNGDTRDRTIPYRQPSLNMIKQAGAGVAFSCALQDDGELKCWGYNGQGQLGDNSLTTKRAPTKVRSISAGVQLSVGANHSCVIERDGLLYCWGYNGVQESHGRLGSGGTNSSSSPLRVVSIDRVRAVSAGDSHSCAVRQNGELWCWGDNSYGQLGLGTTADSLVPILNRNVSNVVDVSCGQFHTCAVTADRRIYCWGLNDYGQVGDGTTTDKRSPVLLNGLTGVLDVDAGYYHTCATTTDNRALCWGRNDYGQLGDGTTTPRSSPTLVR